MSEASSGRSRQAAARLKSVVGRQGMRVLRGAALLLAHLRQALQRPPSPPVG